MARGLGIARMWRAGRWRRALLIAIVAGLISLLAVIVVASLLLSSLLIDPQSDLISQNVETIAVGGGKVVLSRSTDSARPGVYGLDWPQGHAIVGSVIATKGSTVTRQLLALTGRLAAHTQVGVDANVWSGDPESSLGIAFRSLTFPDPLGPMPAWFVPGRGSTWVIFVHGIDGTRAGGLRPLAILHALGLPTLLIDYRNDPGAPRSPDGHVHLGMTESEDLAAAARWAIGQGAQRLILYGDSLGGAVVTRFMRHYPLARRVVALVLDAPVLDWPSVIDHVSARFHVPFLGSAVRLLIGARIAVDWNDLDEISHARSFHLPILLFQGEQDPLVPTADSQAFAHAAPGPVTYVPVADVGHVESWNGNPVSYDDHLLSFLTPFAPAAGVPNPG